MLSAQLKNCGIESAEWVERYQNARDDYQEILVSVQRKYAYCLVDGIGIGDPYFLILEDDADIPDDLAEVLKKCLAEAEAEKASMVSLGESHGLHFCDRPDHLLQYKPNLQTRCCHAILYSHECALRIVSEKSFWIVDKPIDHKLNDLITLLNIKHYWYEPGIRQAYVRLGSHLDRFRG